MSKYSTDVIYGKTNAPKITKIFSDANEKNTKVIVLYGKPSDKYLYTDEACTQKITKDKLFEMATKGVIVKYDDLYYTPLIFGYDKTKPCVTITIGTLNEGLMTYVVLNSEEYTEE